jgi:alpha-tubulin suppressor-like RCC1 family protein
MIFNSRRRGLVCLLVLGFVLGSCSSVFADEAINWGNTDDFDVAPPPAETDFVAIADGYSHALGLKSDGSIVAWGSNHQAEISSPEGNDFVAVSAGDEYSIALKADGSLYTWGPNYSNFQSPPSGNDFVKISAGGDHCLALKSDGSIVAWGNDGYDLLLVPTGNDFVEISAGNSHSLALKKDGSIVAWGGDDMDVLDVPAGDDFIAIDACISYNLALKYDGSIVAWGDYDEETIPSGNDFVAIYTASAHSLALKSDGSIVGWGDNTYGQVTVPEGTGYTAIAAADTFSVALKHVPNPVEMEEIGLLGRYWGADDFSPVSNTAKADYYTDGVIDLLDLWQLGICWLGDDMEYFVPTVFDVPNSVEMEEIGLLSRYWGADDFSPVSDTAKADFYVDGVIDMLDLWQLGVCWLADDMEYFVPTVFDITDGFESGDFSELAWASYGDASWEIVSDVANSGVFAAKSGAINVLDESVLEFSLDCTGADTISFMRKVSSENALDKLVFYIDGVSKGSWSGEVEWATEEFAVDAGVHVFKWVYLKDRSMDGGSDCAWIDDVRVFMAD